MLTALRKATCIVLASSHRKWCTAEDLSTSLTAPLRPEVRVSLHTLMLLNAFPEGPSELLSRDFTNFKGFKLESLDTL